MCCEKARSSATTQGSNSQKLDFEAKSPQMRNLDQKLAAYQKRLAQIAPHPRSGRRAARRK